MKKFFIVVLMFSGFVSSAQQNKNNGIAKQTSILIAVDLNVPIGDFAKSEYQLAGGAEDYYQEGTFNPALGLTIGLEVPLAYDISLRPYVSLASYKGKHKVGDFDNPKMKFTDVRLGSDIIYYVSNTPKNSFYFLGTIGMDIEKLTVDRVLFDENFSSRRISAGVGLGYLFGQEKKFCIEGSMIKSIAGDAPCNENFPDLSIVKLTLGFKI